MEKRLQKICSNLLITQDLWQAYYQILSIIFLEEFMKSNVSSSAMTKNTKLAELNINTVTVDLIEYKCLCCNKNYLQKFDEVKVKGMIF